MVTAAIVARNAIYAAPSTLRAAMTAHLAPLGWQPINPTGDDLWGAGTKAVF
jgi:hypothetical protein